MSSQWRRLWNISCIVTSLLWVYTVITSFSWQAAAGSLLRSDAIANAKPVSSIVFLYLNSSERCVWREHTTDTQQTVWLHLRIHSTLLKMAACISYNTMLTFVVIDTVDLWLKATNGFDKLLYIFWSFYFLLYYLYMIQQLRVHFQWSMCRYILYSFCRSPLAAAKAAVTLPGVHTKQNI